MESYYGSEYKPDLGALKNTKTLLRAEEEADSLLKLTPGERLKKCVFQKNNNDVRSLSRSTGTCRFTHVWARQVSIPWTAAIATRCV